MEIIPSIDLRAGQVVHLRQGDYGMQTVYSADPLAVVSLFSRAEPARIHIVDLDGALAGSPQQLDLVAAMVKAASVPIEFGGGLRSIESVKAVLDLGVERVVLGTAAIQNPPLVRQAVSMFGAERVTVGLDAANGVVSINAWKESGGITAKELMALMGVGRFVYTDIARDGTLSSPNFDAVASLIRHGKDLVVAGDWPSEPQIIASGGVASLAHLQRLAVLGVEGTIVGSAIYQGAVDLGEAIEATKAL